MADKFTQHERAWMRRALMLARRGAGRVEPNPMVGCVLVRGGRIIGEGYHRRFGGPHAEIEALRDANAAVRGATAFVTLEPCSHQGKTPPCTAALIHAGVRRVVAAQVDPFPQVAGRGLRTLRRAGIEVATGLLEDEARALNAPYLTRVICDRPYVIAKWAQSIDGKIATRTGDSQWISGPAARRVVHRLRARVDGVAVGVNTALRDDPALTARGVPVRRIADRIVFDSRLRLPLSAALTRSAAETPVVVLTTGEHARGKRRSALERRGVQVVACRTLHGRVSLRDALRRLHARGYTNLLVEGGGELIGAFADAGLLDEAVVFTAPLIIGGRAAPSGYAGRGCATIARATVAHGVRRRVLEGRDEMLTFRLTAVPGE